MTELAFHWNAEFTDGTIIRQFDENGKEHSFREVQDREDSLVYFWLELQGSPEEFKIGVSLIDGSFNIGELVLHALKDDESWALYKPELRIISFRRTRHTMIITHIYDEHGNEIPSALPPEVDYFIGWQTTYQGKNYKKLLKIGADGTFSVS